VDLNADRAGDVKLTGVRTSGGKIVYDYGEEILETSDGKPKTNLQPTFYSH